MQSIIPRKKGRPPALTQKQKKFAELYVWDRGKKNLSQCAFEAWIVTGKQINGCLKK